MRAFELFATKHTHTPSSGGGEPQPQTQPREELWLTLDGIEEVYKISAARQRFLQKHERHYYSKEDDDNSNNNSNSNNNGGGDNDNDCGDATDTDRVRIVTVMPRIRIVLRIWVPDGHSQVPLGEKFGMRSDHIDPLVKACLEAGFEPDDIIGVSFHCGSGCESVETYLEALTMGRAALEAIDRTLQKLLGGAGGSSSPKTPRCWLLDMGGGFPGLDGLDGDEGRFAAAATAIRERSTAEKPAAQTTVADIAVAVRPVLQSFVDSSNNHSRNHSHSNNCNCNDGEAATQQNPPLTLIAEPGRYFVEGAFALASRIYQKQIVVQQPIDTKTNTDADNDNNNNNNNNRDNDNNDSIRVYRIPHGVQGVFKDVLLCGESFVPQPLQTERNNNNDDDEEQQQTHPQQPPHTPKLYPSKVLGPSGDDAEDVVCDSCLLPELLVGDWLVFDRMGAYTLSIASRAGRPVMRYVLGGGGVLLEEEGDREKTKRGGTKQPNGSSKAFW